MEYILEYISVLSPSKKTELGIPNPFPRGYGNSLFLYSDDESTQYNVINLSYEDLIDAISFGIIDNNIIHVKSTIIKEPFLWGYEKKYQIYKSVIVIDRRLPAKCLRT